MKQLRLPLFLLSSIALFFSCNQSVETDSTSQAAPSNPLFKLLPSEQTGINFVNPLEENLNLNVLMYEYLYNGGGVAVGDINGDGLDDLYFSSNVGQNQLYLNQGNLKFKDITSESGTEGRPGPWKTGVVMVDINGDGLLDIYQCHSGALMPEKRKNELFVNQGVNAQGIPQFKEMAEEYGIASENTSTSAAFFDYDLDGDLDLFLLNHNIKSIQNMDVRLTKNLLKEKHEAGSQLFENRNGKFTEVTEKAGISSSSLSYGLGVNVSDINQDGWPDIYIGNDYTMPDYLYINQKNGTFKDEIQNMLDQVSHFSMGNDIADINNDGLVDIFTLDMLPEDNQRQKLLLSPDNFEAFQFNVDRGFYYQYMRNMLHLNAGDGTFHEIGQLSGISNTDWSWSALFTDLDLDGWKDLFITNGYLRDYNNQDFLKYMDNYVQTKGGQLRREDLLTLVKSMTSSNLKNYTFRNRQDLTFENVSDSWGLPQHANTNGAAYADLDNDGDMDLILNNLNAPAIVYENLSIQQQKGNYLKIKLKGEDQNSLGLGAKVTLFTPQGIQYQELSPFRGYQSSVAPYLTFGMGTLTTVDSIQVSWPGGKITKLAKVEANQTLELTQSEAKNEKVNNLSPEKGLFASVSKVPLSKGQEVNDFKRQPLMSFGISGNGKAMVLEDFNGDGETDMFVGGDAGLSGKMIFGLGNGKLGRVDSTGFMGERASEDVVAIAFDANGDGFKDLYVASGGVYQFSLGDDALSDRLYLNDGKGKFSKSPDALPKENFPTGAALAEDLNGDGILDLLVGARVNPGQYPTSPGARIWIGDGKGKFTDQTQSVAPTLAKLGMITGAAMADFNSDGVNELVFVGDAMPITVFSKKNKTWENSTSDFFALPQVGLWSDLLLGDWDQDGKLELLVGNHGKNSQLFASDTQPMELLYKDFDANGSTDAILGYYIKGEKYPSPSRDEILGQVNFLKKRYLDFKSFSEVKMDNLLTVEERKDASSIFINRLETSYFVLNADGKFISKPLPIQAQFAPVFAAEKGDFNADGHLDMILGGNLLDAKLKFGRYTANHLQVFLGDGKGNFTPITAQQSGVSLRGEVRAIEFSQGFLLVKQNGQAVHLFRNLSSKD
ncbi:VCBS repeat-containing protein [Algoriphagus aquatilis]|uniref:VCBS repeat-containing protein n=1 Tax=Algoriphagus aquatilis TaxID=490186 RepID=A0ABW0BZ73_9BACT